MKKLLSIALVMFSSQILDAQNWTQKLIQFNSTQVNTDQVTTVLDYDNDGREDILYGNMYLRELFLLRNNENHILQLEQLADTFYNVLWLHGFEYNNDGLDDFIIAGETANSGGETFWLAIHQPDNTYDWHFMGYAPYEGLQSMFTEDLDNDGDIDVVYDDYANSNVIWLMTNNGDDTFTQTMISYIGQPTRLYAVEDLDLDGDKDLVTSYFNFTDAGFKLVAQENTGGMAFTAHENMELPGAGSASAVDYNDDGYPDLVLASQNGSGNSVIYTNNGDFSYTASATTLSLTNYAFIGPAIDYENDGDQDFFASDEENLILMKQNANGSFSAQILGQGYYGNIDRLIDIDQDGLTDIISYYVGIWKNLGNSYSNVYSSYLRANSVLAVSNLGPDGNPDIMTGGSAGQISLFNQRFDELVDYGVDEFVTGTNIDYSTTVKDLLSYDKDNDGDQDILCQISTYIFWLVNNNGNYTQLTVANNIGGMRLWIGDLDNDGKHDILYHNSPLQRWEWNGNSYTNTSFIWDVTANYEVMDADNDGDLDIFFFGYDVNSNTTMNYMRNNNGSFALVNCGLLEDYFNSSLTNLGNVAPLHHADVDLDGDQDVVFGSSNSHYVAWLRNDGNSVFTPIMISETFSVLSDFDLGDIDMDGDLDIVASNGISTSLQILRNGGIGDFTQESINEIVSAPANISITDMDHDSDLDIVYNSIMNRRIGWLKNGTIDCPRSYSSSDITVCPSEEVLIGDDYVSIPGLYTDTLTAASGCDSVHVLILNNYQLSPVAIVQTGNILTATSGFSSYQWSLNNNVIDGETENTINVGPYGIGSYQVVGIDENGCSNLATINVANIIGIDEAEWIAPSIWPVPFEDEIFIHSGSFTTQNISMIDQTGRVVFTQQGQCLQNISTRNLPSGVYRIILTSASGEQRHLSAIKK